MVTTYSGSNQEWIVQSNHFLGTNLKACSESFTNCTEHPTLDDPTYSMHVYCFEYWE